MEHIIQSLYELLRTTEWTSNIHFLDASAYDYRKARHLKNTVERMRR